MPRLLEASTLATFAIISGACAGDPLVGTWLSGDLTVTFAADGTYSYRQVTTYPSTAGASAGCIETGTGSGTYVEGRVGDVPTLTMAPAAARSGWAVFSGCTDPGSDGSFDYGEVVFTSVWTYVLVTNEQLVMNRHEVSNSGVSANYAFQGVRQ